MKLGLLLLATGILMGCSSLPEQMCSEPRWDRIGRIDGENGYPAKRLKDHGRQCDRDLTLEDEGAYLQGWNEGIKTYCTAENGYKVGVQGLFSGEACSKEEFPEFAEQFNLGRSVAQLKSERETVRETMDKNLEDSTLASRTWGVVTGNDPNADLEEKDQELSEKIDFLESNAPVNIRGTNEAVLFAQDNQQALIDYSGALVGTILGFGVGHAIQGRYLKDGWKWTAGDVAVIGAMSVAASKCDNTQPTDRCDSGSAGGALVLGWLGLKIWQSVVLFKYANRNNNIYALPTAQGLVIGASF